MPLFLLKFTRLLSPRGWIVAAIVALVLALALGLYLKGRHDAHARDEARAKIAVAEAIKSDTAADNKSTATLAQEALAIDAKQKELEDAVAKIPDSTPDAVAVAAGCVELRRNGISTADLPACQPAR